MPPVSEAQVQAVQGLVTEARIIKANLATGMQIMSKLQDSITKFEKMFSRIDLESLAACIGSVGVAEELNKDHGHGGSTKACTSKAPSIPAPAVAASKVGMKLAHDRVDVQGVWDPLSGGTWFQVPPVQSYTFNKGKGKGPYGRNNAQVGEIDETPSNASPSTTYSSPSSAPISYMVTP